jgi:hypothetical protein
MKMEFVQRPVSFLLSFSVGIVTQTLQASWHSTSDGLLVHLQLRTHATLQMEI